MTLSAPAPAGGEIVTLSSDNHQVVSVPAIVTVLEGATSQDFAIATPVPGSGSVEIARQPETGIAIRQPGNYSPSSVIGFGESSDD